MLGRRLGRGPRGAGVGMSAHVLPSVSALLGVASPISLHSLSGGSMGLGPKENIMSMF